jgi:hypothetical protein
MRYQTDPARRAVQLRMLEEVARAADLQKEGQWITYLIRDPRYPDKRGNPGTPIYVGQTNDFRERVLSRFNKCEKEASEKGKDCIDRRVADLLHLDIVPTYQVLDYQPTRLNSLVSETNWARKCWKAGYHLANLKRLQNKAGDDLTRSQIPKEWLWEFSLEEAIADDIKAVLVCDACGDELPIPLPTVAERELRPRTLGELRRAFEADVCVTCQTSGKRRLRLTVVD